MRSTCLYVGQSDFPGVVRVVGRRIVELLEMESRPFLDAIRVRIHYDDMVERRFLLDVNALMETHFLAHNGA